LTTLDENWWREWQKARDIIDKCEDRMHDVRKSGFSVVSGLLTAGALLGGKLDESTQDRAGLPLSVMFLALLVGVAVAEKQAMITLQGAASRCRFLESLSPVELTEAITYRFGMERWHRYTVLLYVLFGIAGALVGLTLVKGFWAPLAIVGFGATYFVALTRLYSWQPSAGPGADIFLDRVECEVDEFITIALMNHSGVPQQLWPTVIQVQQVLDKSGKSVNPSPTLLELPVCPATRQSRLQPERTITWLWTTPIAGVYCVNFRNRTGEMLGNEYNRTLRKMIRVRPKAEMKPCVAATHPGAATTGGSS
jgi:hypothetical protein